MSTPPDQTSRHDSLREQPVSKRRRADRLRTGGMIALAVLVTVFGVLNLEEVKVDWVLGSGHAPLIVVIVISVVVGIVLTYMAERLHRRQQR